MRPPTDLPRRRSRARTPGRGRTVLIVVAVVAFVLLTSLRGIAGFYTDYLWFESLGFSSVWRGVLGAKAMLFVIFTGAFFLLLLLNLYIADRIAPRFRPAGPEEEILERYHEFVGPRTGLVRAGIAALFALIAAADVSGQWKSWLLFTNHVRFGEADAQFHTDIGFYVFQLPFLDFVVTWLFRAFLIIFVVTAVAHYLNGGIRVQTPLQRVTPQVKAHLSVLLGILAVIKAADYWLQRYELTFSTRGAVDGALYTDVKAQLPALKLLTLIALFAFALLIWNIWRRGWVLPIIAVGIWGLVWIVAGVIYPQVIQRVRVEPAESEKERPYVERNIAATRAALNIAEVESEPFRYDDNLTDRDLAQNAETIRNVRLLDPRVVEPTFQRLQGVRSYYRFNDLDVDRYEQNGRSTQVVLSARELDPDSVPQKSWEGEHLAYTHGQGVTLAPANGVDENGRPDFQLSGVPVRGSPKIDRPGVYFGEELGGYAIVKTKRQEIDYETSEGAKFTGYEGEGGVELGSVVRRFAFFLRFGDFNPLISNFIDGDSEIIYIRDIRDRVEKLAPFLSFDADPYPVVFDGRVVWVVDAYTTTDHYPNAQRAETGQLPDGSGLDHRFNYARNSVKAVIDAYDGTVSFYIVDPEDPIARAYRKAFPKLFKDRDEIPRGLNAHFRYPEDIFRVQTNMWGRYHVSDPRRFLQESDAWSVAQDPGTDVSRQTTGTTTAAPTTSSRRIDPYYLLMRLPDAEREEFLMLRPFVPSAGGGTTSERSELIAFMVAKSDPEQYGELTVFTMPSEDLPDGPAIVAGNILAQNEISREISLLNEAESEVKLGNLLLIPIEDSILYVRPFYVQAQGDRAIPELQRVIVANGSDVVMANTLQEALEELPGIDNAPSTLEGGAGQDGGGGEDEPEGEEPTVAERRQQLLRSMNAAFEAAEKALADGNLGEYQEKVAEAQRINEDLQELEQPESTTTTTEPANV